MLDLQKQDAFDRVVSTGACCIAHRVDRLANLSLKQRRPREPLRLRGGQDISAGSVQRMSFGMFKRLSIAGNDSDGST